jgi:hypothetical protein
MVWSVFVRASMQLAIVLEEKYALKQAFTDVLFGTEEKESYRARIR